MKALKRAFYLVLSTLLLALSAFSLFGFLASFEPGNSFLWKVGYGTLGCACLAGSMVMFVWGTKRSRKTPDENFAA